MSLLSVTNYTPQRVFALLRLLDAQGGELEFETIRTWFKPEEYFSNLNTPEDANIRQMLGAATSLDFIESPSQNRYRLNVRVPESLEAFSDLVHDRLVCVGWDNPDSIMFEAFAATVVITEMEQNTQWLEESVKTRADRIQAAVREADGNDEENSKRFNSTKMPPWKRWMIFLGLGISFPKGELYPYPVSRLEREINREIFEKREVSDRLEIDQFLNLVSRRMPYLDGGRFFESAANKSRLPHTERKLTRVLSGALRDLHDDKRVALETVGDAKQIYTLIGEPHAVKNVSIVHLNLTAVHV